MENNNFTLAAAEKVIKSTQLYRAYVTHMNDIILEGCRINSSLHIVAKRKGDIGLRLGEMISSDFANMNMRDIYELNESVNECFLPNELAELENKLTYFLNKTGLGGKINFELEEMPMKEVYSPMGMRNFTPKDLIIDICSIYPDGEDDIFAPMVDVVGFSVFNPNPRTH